MVGNTLKQAQERWKQLSETIQNMSTVNVAETKAAQLERIERARKDYAYFVALLHGQSNRGSNTVGKVSY